MAQTAQTQPGQYPQHERAMQLEKEKDVLGDFWDFLAGKGIVLCTADSGGHYW